MIVCGSAGPGKSYLINCIKEMLGGKCILAAPVIAAFNIGGQTLHSLLRIPLQKASFSDVQGPSFSKTGPKTSASALIRFSRIHRLDAHRQEMDIFN